MQSPGYPPMPRVLSVRQPHASAFFYADPRKDVENRRWPTDYRGALFIHAALTEDPDWKKSPNADLLSALPADMVARRGVIMGMVQLTGCVRDSDSRWALPGYHHWVMQYPASFPGRVVEERGRLRLWIPDTTWLRRMS